MAGKKEKSLSKGHPQESMELGSEASNKTGIHRLNLNFLLSFI